MSRKLPQRLGLTAVLAVALISLSGCFKVAMNLDVKGDDTVNGSLITAIDKKYTSLLGGRSLSGLDATRLQDSGASTTTKPYEDGTFIGQEIDFSGASLSGLNRSMVSPLSARDRWSLTHSDGRFVFDAAIDMSSTLTDLSGAASDSSGSGSTGAAQSLLGNASFIVSITFPGKVVSTNGTVKGSTVTWVLDLTGPNTLTATAEDHASPLARLSSGFWISAGAGLIVLAVVGYVMAQRRRAPPGASSGEGDAV